MPSIAIREGVYKSLESSVERNKVIIHSMVRYDLLGKLAGNTELTRKSIAEILGGIHPAVSMLNGLRSSMML